MGFFVCLFVLETASLDSITQWELFPTQSWPRPAHLCEVSLCPAQECGAFSSVKQKERKRKKRAKNTFFISVISIETCVFSSESLFHKYSYRIPKAFQLISLRLQGQRISFFFFFFD